jgi:hypothetical protein
MNRRPSQQRFQKVENVSRAVFAKYPPEFAANDRIPRGLRRKGLAFEAEVQEALKKAAKGLYFPSPWIIYTTGGGFIHWCQPDGLYFDPTRGHLYIIECKLRHTADAWWQLHEVYAPVLARMFPRELWELRFVEIVRWYDPSTYFPGRHFLRKKVTQTERGETGVIIWSRRRKRSGMSRISTTGVR